LTNGEYLIKELFEKREQIDKLTDDIEEIESGLIGMELKYKGHDAVIAEIDGPHAVIYYDLNGRPYNVIVTLERLRELLGGEDNGANS
jgi:hypothetical protein